MKKIILIIFLSVLCVGVFAQKTIHSDLTVEGSTTSESFTDGTFNVALGAFTGIVSFNDGTANWTTSILSGFTRIAGVTYGSDGSVSDVELLYINTLGSNAQTQLDVRCLEAVFGTSLGTGIILDGTVLKTSLGLQSISGLTETNGGLLYGTADNTYAWLAAGTAGYLLQGNGVGAPSFVTSLADGFTATTQGAGDNSLRIATTAFITAATAFSFDATNQSSVEFTINGITVKGSFGHDHNQYLLKTGGLISGDVSITGNLDITGAFTVAEFTQYISIPSGQATVGGTAPAPTTIGTWRALRFNANAELAFIEFEIPNDWIGTSDMTIKIYGYPTAADIVQAGEIIEFDAEYRSIAEGEAYDNGTSVTISPTYTQSGVGTDKALIELTVLIDFDDANQPLTKGDVVGIKCFRDVTTSDTYSGDFDVVKWEIQYQANTFPIHQN